MFIASLNRDATCQNRQIDVYVQGRCRFTRNLFSLIPFCCLHEGGLGLGIPFEHAKKQSGPKVIKLFTCSTQLSTKFRLLIKTKILTNKEASCFESLRCCIYHANKC